MHKMINKLVQLLWMEIEHWYESLIDKVIFKNKLLDITSVSFSVRTWFLGEYLRVPKTAFFKCFS